MCFTNLNISVIRTAFGPRGVRICEGLLYYQLKLSIKCEMIDRTTLLMKAL